MSGICISNNYLPTCWSDDVRMNSLFLPFRPFHLNPQGWNDKMSFWTNLIMEYCSKMKKAKISHADLCQIFERNGRQPQCLELVIEEMKRQGTVSPLNAFTSKGADQSLMWLGYDLLVKRPLSWGWSLVQNAVIGKNQTDELFINIPVIKEVANTVLKKHEMLLLSHVVDYIVVLSEFYEHCKDICSDFPTFKLALIQLQHDGHLKLFNENNQEIIKFRENVNEEIQSVSETDMASFRLQKAKEILEKQIMQLDYEADRCKEEARHAIQQGSRTKAAALLRKKKRIEKLIEKKGGCLENIESLQDKLQESKADKLVFGAYQSATQLLKQVLDKDLSSEKLDSSLADLEEVFDMKAEIDNILSRPIGAQFDPNMSELEAELEEILKENEHIPENAQADVNPDFTNVMNKLHSIQIPTEDLPSDRTLSSRTQPVLAEQLI